MVVNGLWVWGVSTVRCLCVCGSKPRTRSDGDLAAIAQPLAPASGAGAQPCVAGEDADHDGPAAAGHVLRAADAGPLSFVCFLGIVLLVCSISCSSVGMHSYRHTDTQAHRHTDTQTHIHSVTYTDTLTHWSTCIFFLQQLIRCPSSACLQL
jgi:hypothetical protein